MRGISRCDDATGRRSRGYKDECPSRTVLEPREVRQPRVDLGTVFRPPVGGTAIRAVGILGSDSFRKVRGYEG